MVNKKKSFVVIFSNEENRVEHNDQLLSVNGLYFDQVNFENALSLLAGKREQESHIELVVARQLSAQTTHAYQISNSIDTNQDLTQLATHGLANSLYALYDLQNDFIFYSTQQMTIKERAMVLNTEWTQLETIELLNESGPVSLTASSGSQPSKVSGASGGGAGGAGGGFGFGITGNKSTGVVVKAITIGGSAYKVSHLIFYFHLLLLLPFSNPDTHQGNTN